MDRRLLLENKIEKIDIAINACNDDLEVAKLLDDDNKVELMKSTIEFLKIKRENYFRTLEELR